MCCRFISSQDDNRLSAIEDIHSTILSTSSNPPTSLVRLPHRNHISLRIPQESSPKVQTPLIDKQPAPTCHVNRIAEELLVGADVLRAALLRVPDFGVHTHGVVQAVCAVSGGAVGG